MYTEWFCIFCPAAGYMLDAYTYNFGEAAMGIFVYTKSYVLASD